jgi:hypothetical protein
MMTCTLKEAMLRRQRHSQQQLPLPPCSLQGLQQFKSLRSFITASQMGSSSLLHCLPLLQRLHLSMVPTPVQIPRQQLCVQGPPQQLRQNSAQASMLSHRCQKRLQTLPLQQRLQWNQIQRQHVHQVTQQAHLTLPQAQTKLRKYNRKVIHKSSNQMMCHPQLQSSKQC